MAGARGWQHHGALRRTGESLSSGRAAAVAQVVPHHSIAAELPPRYAEMVRKALDINVADHSHKPVSLEDLLEVINECRMELPPPPPPPQTGGQGPSLMRR
jgi:hypothetical protein